MNRLSTGTRLAAFALACAIAAPCAAQREGGATPPTTAPATASTTSAPAAASAKLDLSSPTAAVLTMLTAIHDNDFATVRKALDIPAANANDTDALLSAMEATGKMQQAAHAKFGAAGDKSFGTPTAVQLADQLKLIAEAKVAQAGNAATLTLPANTDLKMAGGAVKLKMIGAEWKIDGPSFLKMDKDPPATIAARTALTNKLTAIAQAMAAEINDGKFFSAADAYIEYWNRCQAATK